MMMTAVWYQTEWMRHELTRRTVCNILGAVSIINGSCVLGAVTFLVASFVGGLLLGIAVCDVVVPAVGKDVNGGRARRRMAAHGVCWNPR